MALRAAAHERAEACWLRRRDQPAIFFRCVAVYAGHIARLVSTEHRVPRRLKDLSNVATATAMHDGAPDGLVRLPLMELPPAMRLLALPDQARGPLRALLIALRAAAHLKAQHCWATRKAPLAGYWRAVALYAGLVARLLR